MAGEQNVCEARGITAYAESWPPSVGVGYVDSSRGDNLQECSETVYGVEIGTENDISADADNFCGVKVGMINSSPAGGDLSGVHAGFVNVAGWNLNGVQAGFVNAAELDARGFQLGVLNAAGRNMVGFFQIGGINYADWNMRGFQAGVSNVARQIMNGFQIAIYNMAGDMDGFQIGVFNIAYKDMRGMKVALANSAGGELTGVPIGVFNFSGRCRGRFATPILGLWCLFGREVEFGDR